ncbi:MAG TPA: DUF4249 domain-containing protein [Chitinophagaceae bacterium]|nr:DUF4249 domain-containing protein [Chitinophagaceae bacterium]
MQRPAQKYYCLLLLWLLLVFTQCRKPYVPAVFIKGDNYLVVDGFINTSPGGSSTVLLSRTKNLTDTVLSIPENNAAVSIQAAGGASFALTASGTDGRYTSGPLSLTTATQYKIVINTADKQQYASDLVTARVTPAIDSITWQQNSKGVQVFANTHDAGNNTRYYRWQYIETWEYHSQLETIWGVNNGVAYVRTPEQQVHTCYVSTPSSRILLGSTAALARDVVSNAVLATLPPNDSTLQYRASFLVQQYALTPQAYFYWQIIQKNAEQLGSLFDLQPSQLEGNIHCLTNPAEPVVGFMSATTVQEKRIFINNSDLQNWQPGPGSYDCSVTDIAPNPVNFLIINFPDDSYAPWYYVSNGPLKMAKKACLDCTLSGGVNIKPLYW